jgi:hypothetical protein
MDQPHAKPPERRRRRLVVAFVLVPASMVVWWHWPRGDARFVGKWERYLGSGERMALRESGTAYFTYDPGTSPSKEMAWGVFGDQFVLGSQSKLKVKFVLFIEPAYQMLTGKVLKDVGNRFSIVSVTPDKLEFLRDGSAFTYRRIPE